MALQNTGSFSKQTPAVAANSNAPSLSDDDPTKKVRKPYTISKSRESWTEPEHDKFLEALQLFDRDWKKIEAFVASKTVIQIRSHAQKYFQKVQKSGTNEHLPPPRPKRKAAHPYPQKASKSGASQVPTSVQGPAALPDAEMARNSVFLPIIRATSASLPSRTDNSMQAGSDLESTDRPLTDTHCWSSNKNSSAELTNKRAHGNSLRVLPDFNEVYNFIGSIFDPNVSGHLQKLKKMDRIDVETVLLLMRNLTINLMNPDFENHKKLLSSYEVDGKEV
ncbi:PREDICTED: protein REVEILLE 6-like isoform X3 [Ipomoea nil]|uniref:protein REVEILLE 6-like isoform X3 n=1 Tax=Ipomoea nil TaxID=35883 RepID=UPI000901D3FD|nr:PREDICTED: protein REVEILLE 6-like isoform X3 [Ipomoea nil]